MRRTHHLGSWVCVLSLALSAAHGLDGIPEPDGFKTLTETKWPEVALRGYGPLSGRSAHFTDAAGGTLTALLIQADDTDKARLTLAKYTADLQRLGPVRATVLAGYPVVEVPGQGWIAGVTRGRDVLIVATPAPEALTTYLAGLGDNWQANTDAKVPMYLDAWDQYGFRFYYRPWETPPNTKWKDYNVLDEFDFAKRLGDLGFVFWETPCEIDTGPAVTNSRWWDWAERAAARRNLPVVINTMSATPTWLLNRYRDQVMMNMPQFCGSFHSVAEPSHDGLRQLSWCATTAKDAQLAILQQTVHEYATHPQALDWLEPHGELAHGAYDVLVEYGPAADASFRTFLRERYGSVKALNRRWHGDTTTLRDWDDVHVPELASFLGWGPMAVDLTGDWQIGYETLPEDVKVGTGMNFDDLPSEPAPDAWYAPEFDASEWPVIQTPGHDLTMFLPKRPAVLRREFELAPDWIANTAPTWLYIWDLNCGEHRKSWMRAVLNGHEVGRDLLQHPIPHWAAFKVTPTLQPGRNQLALRLPKGILAYRVYLSRSPPLQYPALGELRNAQWVDFCDWRQWTRLEMCRRGMEMIRQADPDRSIVCMAPDGFASGIKRWCEEYGAHFHNTGHMGAFWNDFLPMLMRGADLPFSLEPGGPAGDLTGFKHMMGLYFTEGIQAVHYFIHVGNIFWPDDIRQHFEAIQPLVRTIGKVHPPKAQVAMLLSDRINGLAGYPWGKDYNTNLPTGYWGWRFSDALADDYHVDAVTDQDFGKDGNAEPYRVIIDTNTAVMDEATVDQIDAWVRQGGIFVTAIQTGRHTPEHPDSWPINRLTGYRVLGVDPHAPDGGEGKTRGFTFVEGQPVFAPSDWPGDRNHYANGISLEKVAPECLDLLRWADGPVAAGLRPLGKGYVVHLGIKFGAGRGGGGGNYRLMFDRVLQWAKVPRVPARADGVMLRHNVSNNGLYDVWTLWNPQRDKALQTRLVFRDGPAPAACTDVLTGQPFDLASEISLPALETRILLTPRGQVETAPADWFTLQRNWWRGTKPPQKHLLPLPETPNACDLSSDWAYRVLDENGTDDPAPLAAPELDDGAWPRRPLNVWAIGEELPSRRVFFRKTFTVPETWQNGDVTLWLRSWFAQTIIGTARYWADGQPLGGGDGRYGLITPVTWTPGSRHCLALEVRGEGQVCGVRANTWLAFTPAPRERLDLAGTWTPSADNLRWGEPLAVPGAVAKLRLVRRQVRVPEAWRTNGQTYLYIKGGYAITGAMVNGRYLRRHHHALGDVTLLNITPLLRFGDENEIEIVLGGGRDDRIDDVHLRFYADEDMQP